jgi:hypothetical protein
MEGFDRCGFLLKDYFFDPVDQTDPVNLLQARPIWLSCQIKLISDFVKS